MCEDREPMNVIVNAQVLIFTWRELGKSTPSRRVPPAANPTPLGGVLPAAAAHLPRQRITPMRQHPPMADGKSPITRDGGGMR